MRHPGRLVACLNLGRTRADEMLALKMSAECGEALQGLVQSLDHGGCA
jgi:hypothetical protein